MEKIEKVNVGKRVIKQLTRAEINKLDMIKMRERYNELYIAYKQLLLSRTRVKELINSIEKQQKELNSLKEIEKSHQEVNGKLRVELEQEKEINKEIAIKNHKIKEESNAYREEIIRLDNELKAKEQEIAYLKSQIPSDKIFYFSDKDYISKDKLKFILSKLNISDIEPWSTYKIDGQILFDLQELL